MVSHGGQKSPGNLLRRCTHLDDTLVRTLLFALALAWWAARPHSEQAPLLGMEGSVWLSMCSRYSSFFAHFYAMFHAWVCQWKWAVSFVMGRQSWIQNSENIWKALKRNQRQGLDKAFKNNSTTISWHNGKMFPYIYPLRDQCKAARKIHMLQPALLKKDDQKKVKHLISDLSVEKFTHLLFWNNFPEKHPQN